MDNFILMNIGKNNMKPNKTQLEIVREQLLSTGEVSRNWCLSRHITRLGSYIIFLKREGLNIEPKDKNRSGEDYVYKLIKDDRQLYQDIYNKQIENVNKVANIDKFSTTTLSLDIINKTLLTLLSKTPFGDVQRKNLILKALDKKTKEWDKLQVIKMYENS